jgi:hypothetical protein
VSMPRPQMQIQSYEPHLGNCWTTEANLTRLPRPSYSNAALLLQKIEEAELTWLPQLSYSPGVAPCNFFLFE